MLYIICPVHNNSKKTFRFISSLFAQTFKDFHLIIVDDGSTDNTRDVIEGFESEKITILSGDGSLFWGGAINLGIRYIKEIFTYGDNVAFANNDIVFYSNDSILSLLRLLKASENFIGIHSLVLNESLLTISSGSNIISWFFFLTSHPFRGKPVEYYLTKSITKEANLMNGRFIIFKPEIFNSEFQIKFPHYLGDLEFSLRQNRKFGYRFAVTTESIVILDQGLKAKEKITFLKSLFSIRSSNNIILKYKFFLAHCPYYALPTALIFTFIKSFFVSIKIFKNYS